MTIVIFIIISYLSCRLKPRWRTVVGILVVAVGSFTHILAFTASVRGSNTNITISPHPREYIRPIEILLLLPIWAWTKDSLPWWGRPFVCTWWWPNPTTTTWNAIKPPSSITHIWQLQFFYINKPLFSFFFFLDFYPNKLPFRKR